MSSSFAFHVTYFSTIISVLKRQYNISWLDKSCKETRTICSKIVDLKFVEHGNRNVFEPLEYEKLFQNACYVYYVIVKLI